MPSFEFRVSVLHATCDRPLATGFADAYSAGVRPEIPVKECPRGIEAGALNHSSGGAHRLPRSAEDVPLRGIARYADQQSAPAVGSPVPGREPRSTRFLADGGLAHGAKPDGPRLDDRGLYLPAGWSPIDPLNTRHQVEVAVPADKRQGVLPAQRGNPDVIGGNGPA